MELLKCHRRLQDRRGRQKQVNEKVCPGVSLKRAVKERHICGLLVRTIVGTEGSMCTCGSP